MIVTPPLLLISALFSSFVTSSTWCFLVNVRRMVVHSEVMKEASQSQSALLVASNDCTAARNFDILEAECTEKVRDRDQEIKMWEGRPSLIFAIRRLRSDVFTFN